MSKSVDSATCLCFWFVVTTSFEGVGRTPAEALEDARRRCWVEYNEAVLAFEEPREVWWEKIAGEMLFVRVEVWAEAAPTQEVLLRLIDSGGTWRESLAFLAEAPQQMCVWGYFVEGVLVGLGRTAEEAREEARLRLEQSLLEAFSEDAWRSLKAVTTRGDVLRLELPASSARRLLWDLTHAPASAWSRWQETFEHLVPGVWCPCDDPVVSQLSPLTVADLQAHLAPLPPTLPVLSQVPQGPWCIPVTPAVLPVRPERGRASLSVQAVGAPALVMVPQFQFGAQLSPKE